MTGVRFALDEPDPYAYDVREYLDDSDRADDAGPEETPADTFARLAFWAGRAADEPLLTYGGRVLAYLLAHGLTGSVCEADLELADHVVNIAVQARDISIVALANISAVRHLIARTLAARAADRGTGTAVPVPRTPPTEPEGNRPSLLTPIPFTQPPSGQKVEVPF